MIRSASIDSRRVRRLALAALAALLVLAAIVPEAQADGTWAVHQTITNKTDFTFRLINSSLADAQTRWQARPAVLIMRTASNTSYFTNAFDQRKRSRQIEATVHYGVYQGNTMIGDVTAKSGVVCTIVTRTGHCSDYHRYESADTSGASQLQAAWTDDGGSPENFNTTITFGTKPPAGRTGQLRISSSRVSLTGPLASVRVHCASANGTRCIGSLAVRSAGSQLGWQGYSVRANRTAVVYVPISVAAANQIARRPRKGVVVARPDRGRTATRAVVLG